MKLTEGVFLAAAARSGHGPHTGRATSPPRGSRRPQSAAHPALLKRERTLVRSTTRLTVVRNTSVADPRAGQDQWTTAVRGPESCRGVCARVDLRKTRSRNCPVTGGYMASSDEVMGARSGADSSNLGFEEPPRVTTSREEWQVGDTKPGKVTSRPGTYSRHVAGTDQVSRVPPCWTSSTVSVPPRLSARAWRLPSPLRRSSGGMPRPSSTMTTLS